MRTIPLLEYRALLEGTQQCRLGTMSVSADMAMETKNPTADTAGRIHGVETVKERSQPPHASFSHKWVGVEVPASRTACSSAPHFANSSLIRGVSNYLNLTSQICLSVEPTTCYSVSRSEQKPTQLIITVALITLSLKRKAPLKGFKGHLLYRFGFLQVPHPSLRLFASQGIGVHMKKDKAAQNCS